MSTRGTQKCRLSPRFQTPRHQRGVLHFDPPPLLSRQVFPTRAENLPEARFVPVEATKVEIVLASRAELV